MTQPLVLSPHQIRDAKPSTRAHICRGSDGKPLILERDLAMIFAERGAGKTLLGLGISIATSGGIEWGGFTADRAKRVLYVDGEMSLADMDDRLRRMTAPLLPSDRETVNQNLGVLSWETQGAGIPNLCEPEGREFIDASIKAFNPHLVILANISCLVGDIPESGGGADVLWQPISDWTVGHRRSRALIWIHHAGRAGTHARGISKREDPLDWVLRLKLAGTQNKGAYFALEWTKTRGRPRPASWSIQVLDNREKLWLQPVVKNGLDVLDDAMQAKLERAMDFARQAVRLYQKKTQQRRHVVDEYREQFAVGLRNATIDEALRRAHDELGVEEEEE